MDRRFDPKRYHLLDEPSRLKWQNPGPLFDWLNLNGDETIVEIGAGTGFFTIPLAKRSKSFKIYAVDVSPEMIEILEGRLKQSELSNVETVLSNGSSLPLKNDLADLVLLINVLHELVEDADIFGEIKRTLKPKGHLAVVDWQKKETAHGPPLHIRLTPEEATTLLQKYSFRLGRRGDIYSHHYTLLFRKL